ncbi:MAG: GNAT family N-acetyltransferase [Pyrinomonadaceae bacterium]
MSPDGNSFNFWQGRLVRLRGVEPSDAETSARWNLDSEAARELHFVWPPISLALIRRDLAELSMKKLEADAFTWVIEDANKQAVGSISTHQCDHRRGVFRYGLSVAREHRRRGYATEAVLLILKYYFEELRYQKCTVGVHSNNPGSIALHERLGFVHEGTLRRMVYTGGQFYDLHHYGMLKEEWERSAHRI